MPRLLSVLLLLALTLAPALGAEGINRFNATIVVEPDGDLVVTENITVTSEQNQIQRGIYRDIPTRYQSKLGGTRDVPFEILSIKRDERPEPYHTEQNANGTRIYIGREDVILPPGRYTYEIKYRMGGMIGFFKEHDELYWNVTGTFWDFPIEEARALVRLPEGATVQSAEGYTGPKGARGQDYSYEKINDTTVEFWTTAPLPSRNGLTIVVTFPKGILPEPGLGQRLQENLPLVLSAGSLVVLFGYYLGVWLAVGRDPQKGVIIPRYEPPRGFSPGAVRYLWKMGWDQKCFTAALINLAVKGLITITQRGKSYTLARTDQPLIQIRPRELKMAQKLFEKRDRVSVKQSNYQVFQAARKALKKGLSGEIERRFFVRNSWYWVPGILIAAVPTTLAAVQAGPEAFLILWLSMWTIGVVAIWSSLFSSLSSRNWPSVIKWLLLGIVFTIPWFVVAGILFFKLSPALALSLVACYALIGIFYHLMKAPTSQGRKMLDEIEGFRLYLSVAEEDRLNLQNPPEKTPELFERFLPYALALDVEQEWSDKFSGVLEAAASSPDSTTRPVGWYSGSSSNLGRNFATAIGASLGGALAAASSSPSSSSGSGGGGSSGGGGGGGGGGGW